MRDLAEAHKFHLRDTKIAVERAGRAGQKQVSSQAIIIHNHISWVAVNRPARKVTMPSRYEVV